MLYIDFEKEEEVKKNATQLSIESVSIIWFFL